MSLELKIKQANVIRGSDWDWLNTQIETQKSGHWKTLWKAASSKNWLADSNSDWSWGNKWFGLTRQEQDKQLRIEGKTGYRTQPSKVIWSLLDREILTSNWICSIWRRYYEPASGDTWFLINMDIRCKKLKSEAGIMTAYK